MVVLKSGPSERSASKHALVVLTWGCTASGGCGELAHPQRAKGLWKQPPQLRCQQRHPLAPLHHSQISDPGGCHLAAPSKISAAGKEDSMLKYVLVEQA